MEILQGIINSCVSTGDAQEDFSGSGHKRRSGVSGFDHFLWCQKGLSGQNRKQQRVCDDWSPTDLTCCFFSGLQLQEPRVDTLTLLFSSWWTHIDNKLMSVFSGGDASTHHLSRDWTMGMEDEKWRSEVTWRSAVYCGLFRERSRSKCSTAAFWIIYCFKGKDWYRFTFHTVCVFHRLLSPSSPTNLLSSEIKKWNNFVSAFYWHLLRF